MTLEFSAMLGRLGRLVRQVREISDLNVDAISFEFKLATGEWVLYRLTAMEEAEGEYHHWLRTVESDIRARCDRHPYQRSSHIDYRLRAELEGMRAFYGFGSSQKHTDPIADQRAAELFLLTCGKKAFDTLKAQKLLPITGSTGTKYTLHKRAAYCVERADNNTKLCAVVPNVPLWDHLLGIKLLIENDEEKFLETANVAKAYCDDGLPGMFSYSTWHSPLVVSRSFLPSICTMSSP